MRLYRTTTGLMLEKGGAYWSLTGIDWDAAVNTDDLAGVLARETPPAGAEMRRLTTGLDGAHLLAPIGSQEVWAAGVTYFRSREARMEESKHAGADDFYARVYDADRPELFFKATPGRVVGPGADVRIRRDSKWNVPEPELALVVNARAQIIGYTIGNDMSSRDIEGANPLYLPQAKVYDGCCALGPGVLLVGGPLPPDTGIRIAIRRRGAEAFTGATSLARMKRTPEELVSWLYLESSFPSGCILLTGTGVIPPSEFTLEHGDEITIEIDGIGTLSNRVGE